MPPTPWKCSHCGEDHGELPMHYIAEAPEIWFEIPAAEREARCELHSDQCIVDDKYFFVVGNLELPVDGVEELFSWNVWVSLSEKNFARACHLWNEIGREAEPPYFGWLSTSLPCYPETLNLKCHVHTREVGRRPRIELEPTDHPLAVQQRKGITLAQVQAFAEQILHGCK